MVKCYALEYGFDNMGKVDNTKNWDKLQKALPKEDVIVFPAGEYYFLGRTKIPEGKVILEEGAVLTGNAKIISKEKVKIEVTPRPPLTNKSTKKKTIVEKLTGSKE